MASYFGFLAFAWGACIGSYANVCIHRIPRLASTVLPRSHCPACGQMIAWHDNIPLLSFIVLGARCRHCMCSISARYVLVELLSALLFLFIWLIYGIDIKTLVYWGLTTALIIGSFIDIDAMIIPDRITLGGMAAGLILSALFPTLHGMQTAFDGLMESLLGLVVGVVWFWVVAKVGTWFFQREAMGMGDVKLIGAIGAFLGWQAVVFSVLVSSVVGAFVGLTLVLTGKKQMQSRIPYGPYLALAAILWVLGGFTLWEMMMGFAVPSMPQMPGPGL